jgi:hypothetical protein
VIMAFTRRDVAYGAVIVWALAGIASNQSDNLTIVAATIVCAAVVVVAFAVSFFYRRRSSFKGITS